MQSKNAQGGTRGWLGSPGMTIAWFTLCPAVHPLKYTCRCSSRSQYRLPRSPPHSLRCPLWPPQRNGVQLSHTGRLHPGGHNARTRDHGCRHAHPLLQVPHKRGPRAPPPPQLPPPPRACQAGTRPAGAACCTSWRPVPRCCLPMPRARHASPRRRAPLQTAPSVWPPRAEAASPPSRPSRLARRRRSESSSWGAACCGAATATW